MILTISGVDCSGKSRLTKDLAKHFKLQLFDTGYAHPDTSASNWPDVVIGINTIIAQMYYSLDNFCKDRGSIDEFVYQQVYNRSGIDWRVMDFAGIEKQVIILVDIEYDKYLKNMSFRPNEKPFTRGEFDRQRELFIEALCASACPTRIILENTDTYEKLLNDAIVFIEKIKKDPFSIVRRKILTCRKCSLFEQCKQCNPEYARPILPWKGLLKTKFLFIGLAPGRAINVPFSNYCFTHSSGKFLKRALSELGMWDESAFANVCNCNTPTNKIIPQECANICIKTHLIPLIDALPNLSKIFILGNYTQQLITNTLPWQNSKAVTFTRIWHPSAFNYSYSDDKFEQWKKEILKVVNQ